MAEDYKRAVTQVILKHYTGKAWAVLHDGRQWQLGTPEIEKIMTEHITTTLTGSLTHHAYVAGPSQIKLWQVAKITAPPTYFEIRLFEDMDAAEAWLADFGYTRS